MAGEAMCTIFSNKRDLRLQYLYSILPVLEELFLWRSVNLETLSVSRGFTQGLSLIRWQLILRLVLSGLMLFF